MKITREYCIPSKNTFSMKPLLQLTHKYINQEKPSLIIDPFARECRIANITNDLDPEFKTTYNMDAYEFLQTFNSNSVSMILFDPPFTPRQVKECYSKLDRTVNWQDTQYTFWRKIKDEITRILKVGGISITCGYNSNGIGLKNGFVVEEILLLQHGTNHNDTIVTVERKVQGNLF